MLVFLDGYLHPGTLREALLSKHFKSPRQSPSVSQSPSHSPNLFPEPAGVPPLSTYSFSLGHVGQASLGSKQ